MRDAAPVSARDLTKRFGRLTVLSSVTFALDRGEWVGLLGPNGAGKTTLIRLVGTALRPTAGDLRLFGTSVSPPDAAVRRRIGMLSHESLLYPELTVRENLYFYGRLFGVEDLERQLAHWVDALGLLGWQHRPVRTLSRGLEQRAALIRALLPEPDLLLLDEPYSGLDAEGRATLAEILAERQRDGTAALVATHDPAALAGCQRAILLRGGRLAWEGRPEDARLEGARPAPPAA